MKTALFSAFSCLLLCSCLKEVPHHHHRNIPASVQNLAGTYSLVGMSLLTAAATEQDLFPYVDACLQDNIYHFKPNGEFMYTDAGMVCEPAKHEVQVWTLIDSKAVRIGTTMYRIEQFNGMRLALVKDTLVNGAACKIITKLLRR